MSLKGKVVLVTGASTGIGAATARLLTEKGARVALAARSKDKLKALSAEMPGSFVAPVDLTDHATVKRMVADVHSHYGRIDALVNNAGRGGSWAHVERIDIDVFRRLMELNVYGQIVAMQNVVPIMRAQGGGAIVNVGSGTVKMLIEGGTVYPGTKVLLQHVTRIARLELEKDGIVVGIVHPYITNTPFFQNLEATGGDSQEPATARPGLMERAQPPEMPAAAIVEMIETGVPEISLIPRELVGD